MVSMWKFLMLLFVSNVAFVSSRVITGESNDKLQDANSFEELEDYFSNMNAGADANDVSNKIIGTGKKLLNIVVENVELAKKVHSKITKETEELITNLAAGLEGLENKHKEYAIASAEKILESTIKLRHTRETLNEVVQRVKYTIKDLKAIAQSIFDGEITEEDDIDRIINHQVAMMRDLIKETKEIIDHAKKDYKIVRDTFGAIQSKLLEYKEAVRVILDSSNINKAEHERNTEIARASVYSSCGTSTIACAFADIVLLGACSGINAAVCIPIIATMEASVATVGPQAEALAKKANEAYAAASKIYKDQDNLQAYLTKETRMLGHLDAALSTADNNLKLSNTIFKINVPTMRSRYMQSLVDLELAAQQYLDQDELGEK